MTPALLLEKIQEFAPPLARSVGGERRSTWLEMQAAWVGWLGEYTGPGYYGRQEWNRSAEFVYNHLQSPTMLLWLAEAAGIPSKQVALASNAETSTPNALPSACAAIRKVISWEDVELLLKDKGAAYRRSESVEDASPVPQDVALPSRAPRAKPTAPRPSQAASRNRDRLLPSDLDAVLQRLGFSSPVSVDGVESVARLFRANARSGLYILELRDNTVYAGRTKDFTRRFVQHRQSRDIVRVRFQKVAHANQTAFEDDVIGELDALLGASLENIVGTSWPKGPSVITKVLPLALQQRFESDDSFNDDSGPRVEDPVVRARTDGRMVGFLKHPDASRVLEFLKAYIPACIAAFKKTERQFWSLSCLPGVQGRDDRLHARLNIYWQEVMAIFSEGGLGVAFHVAKSPLEARHGKAFRTFVRKYPGAEVREFHYKPGGRDQCRVLADGDTAFALLADPDFLKAARLINLRLMQKGPCDWGRSHCFALVDRALGSP